MSNEIKTPPECTITTDGVKRTWIKTANGWALESVDIVDYIDACVGLRDKIEVFIVEDVDFYGDQPCVK